MAIEEDVENNSIQAEIVEPLLPQNKVPPEEDGSVTKDGAQESKKENEWMVYFSTIVAVWGSYEFGCCAGYSSPTQAAIREDLNLSLSEYSVFGSILTIGAMIGAITSGPIADFIGRKGAMRTAVAFCVAGWLAIYFAQGALALDFGRLSTGYGMGVFSYVVPVFVAEIAPKHLRGRLTTLNQLMIVTGVSVSFLIGTLVTWRTLALIGLIPCAILLVGLFFIPESPRYLANMGRQKEFDAALRKLRGKDADITQEATEIQDYIETLQSLPKANILDLFQRKYLRSVTIGVGLMVCQQFGGINGICFYVSEIFVSAGFNANLGTTIYAILQIVVTALGASLIDRAGRRALLLTSGTGLVIGCILAAVAFYMKVNEFSVNAVPALVLTGILVYIGSFSIGMGAVPWVVMSEIFPINVKGVAGSLATLTNWFGSWVCSYTFNYLMAWSSYALLYQMRIRLQIFPINVKGVAGSLATLTNWFGSWVCSYTFNYLMAWSSYGTFIIYAVINALAVLFIAVMVPETKGRSLEEIQAAINKS